MHQQYAGSVHLFIKLTCMGSKSEGKKGLGSGRDTHAPPICNAVAERYLYEVKVAGDEGVEVRQEQAVI